MQHLKNEVFSSPLSELVLVGCRLAVKMVPRRRTLEWSSVGVGGGFDVI